ncbi:MAG: hypothetical protein JXR58_05015 [Bacteroidales bacterium]|nr:hypothetical protein [Bacteroidales bacterium]
MKKLFGLFTGLALVSAIIVSGCDSKKEESTEKTKKVEMTLCDCVEESFKENYDEEKMKKCAEMYKDATEEDVIKCMESMQGNEATSNQDIMIDYSLCDCVEEALQEQPDENIMQICEELYKDATEEDVQKCVEGEQE